MKKESSAKKATKGTKNQKKRKTTRRKRSRNIGNLPIIIAAIVLAILVAIIWSSVVKERNRKLDILRRHPMKYTDEIRQCAEERGLDPAYIASVVLAESSYDPMATSSVGAQGLMQIMPETGEWIAGHLDETYTEGCLYDPLTNLRYGCWYLSYLMNRYDNDKRCSSAAYHSGQGTVDKWLQDPAYSSDGKTLDVIGGEHAPVYVDRIMKYYEVYVGLYEEES